MNKTQIEKIELAVNGGHPVRSSPLPSWPHFDEDEQQAVSAVLASGKVNYWTGENCKRFESEFSEKFGFNYSISVSNGTAALELALLALGIGKGDEVIVPAATFIATASAVDRVGAKPVVVDVDINSMNISAEHIVSSITENTKAIIVVHLAGNPCDMDKIIDIAESNKLKLIEDCAQAIGAKYRNKYVGSFGDAAAFSFCQDKIMSTGGEGGMLSLQDKSIWEKAWSLKDHGKNYVKMNSNQTKNQFNWIHDSFGTNWRMTEMQATIGRLQLRKLDNWVHKRKSNYQILEDSLKDLKALNLLEVSKYADPSFYRFYITLNQELIEPSWKKVDIIEAINAEGIPCFNGSCSNISRELAFRKYQDKIPRLEIADKLGETAIAFLVHPTLSEQDILDTAKAIKKVFLDITL